MGEDHYKTEIVFFPSHDRSLFPCDSSAVIDDEWTRLTSPHIPLLSCLKYHDCMQSYFLITQLPINKYFIPTYNILPFHFI